MVLTAGVKMGEPLPPIVEKGTVCLIGLVRVLELVFPPLPWSWLLPAGGITTEGVVVTGLVRPVLAAVVVAMVLFCAIPLCGTNSVSGGGDDLPPPPSPTDMAFSNRQPKGVHAVPPPLTL